MRGNKNLPRYPPANGRKSREGGQLWEGVKFAILGWGTTTRGGGIFSGGWGTNVVSNAALHGADFTLAMPTGFPDELRRLS